LEGRKGRNLGIAISLSNLNRVLFGIHQRRYYLIGADSGVGKTSLANYVFVLEAYVQAKLAGKRIKIFYYSFEIAEEDLVIKWAVEIIKIKYDIDLHMDYLQSRIPGMVLTDEHNDMLDDALDFIAEMMQCMTIVDTPKNPTAIFHQLIEYAEATGIVERTDHIDKKLKDDKGKPKVTTYITGFTPHDPEELVEVIIDHVALANPEQGKSTKETIDLLSKYMVFVRNRFGYSPILIQQFNAELQSVERRKFKAAALAPQRMDFGDSKYTYRDADIVIGMINPSFFDISEFYGYAILPGGKEGSMYYLGEFFVMAFIMKNRYGMANIPVPLLMNGMCGTFYDLPNPTEDFELEEAGEYVIKLRAICQSFSPQPL
jgi:hypothetical protein